MDNKNSIPINLQNDNEVQIELMANDNDLNNLSIQNLSFQNNSMYPNLGKDNSMYPNIGKDNSMYPNIGKDNEMLGGKLVKEKQGKILPKELTYNSNNYSFQQDINNNQDDTIVEKEESLQKVIRVNLNDLYKNPPIMNDQRLIYIFLCIFAYIYYLIKHILNYLFILFNLL